MENTAQTGTQTTSMPQAIIQRAIAMVKESDRTWDQIKLEPTTVQRLYTEWILPVAAVPVVVNFINSVFIGVSIPGANGTAMKVPLMAGLVSMIVSYAISLAMMYVSAFIISKLAPKFGGNLDIVGGLKICFFAAIPYMIASIVLLIPFGILLYILVSLYSLYLFYLGTKKLSNVPAERHIGYFVVSIISIIVVSFVAGLLFAPLMLLA